MNKFCILLSVVILANDIGLIPSHASKDHFSKVTTKSRRLKATTQSDYFFDGSGFEESGFDPKYDDTEGDDDDADEEDRNDPFIGFGSGMDMGSSPEPTSTATPSTTSRIFMSVSSTASQATVDVRPTEEVITAAPKKVLEAEPGEDNTMEVSLTTETQKFTSLIVVDKTSSTAAPSSPTTATSSTASTTLVSTRSTRTTSPSASRTTSFSRPSRRTTTTSTTSTTSAPTTSKRISTKPTSSAKDDDLDGDDDDVITDEDYPDINNKLTPGKGEDETDIKIDLNEEQTNEVFSNLPVMYRVSNLPKFAFISQSGVLAGIIAGSIVVLLCLVLFIMFMVYHLKRKSEPAFDRPTRSPVKAGYKKALDKDMYG